MTDICPICEEGQLTHLMDVNKVRYNGVEGTLPSHYSVCNVCGEVVSDSKQEKMNATAARKFIEKVHEEVGVPSEWKMIERIDD